MMLHNVDLSYMKALKALTARSFSRAPGSFKLPRLRSCSRKAPQKSIHHLHQRNNAGVNRRLRVPLRHSWSKRLATLVATSKEATGRVAAVAASSDIGDNNNKSWTKEAQALPNLITFTRIASAPLLGYFVATEQTNYALMGCGIAAFSDWLDGHVARKYNLATRLGTYLDPLGDKVVINFIAVSLLWTPAPIPLPVVGIWLAKDVVLVAGTVFHLQQTAKAVAIKPSMISKINTSLQFTTLAVALGQPVWDTGVLLPLCYTTSFTTIASVLSYGSLAFPGLSFSRTFAK